MSEAEGPVILYVEDERQIREIAVVALEEAGFVVISVASGRDAIAALDERGDDIKALVSDVDLRPGPNGWEVARHAREANPSLPVVYVSGASANDWASMGVPGSLILVKPHAMAQLVVAISTAMQHADAGPAPD